MERQRDSGRAQRVVRDEFEQRVYPRTPSQLHIELLIQRSVARTDFSPRANERPKKQAELMGAAGSRTPTQSWHGMMQSESRYHQKSLHKIRTPIIKTFKNESTYFRKRA